MDNPTNINQDVYDLTPDQLGTALYHIANGTDVSLSYTARFVRDVQNRASAILCNAIEFEDSTIDLDDVLSRWDEVMNSKVAEFGSDNVVYDKGFDPEMLAALAELGNIRRIRGCVSDPSVTCNCTPSEALKCEWSSDNLPDDVFASHGKHWNSDSSW